jgi:hypothetical protein
MCTVFKVVTATKIGHGFARTKNKDGAGCGVHRKEPLARAEIVWNAGELRRKARP